MTMLDKLLGVSLTVTVVLWAISAAIRAYVLAPGWQGAVMAFFAIVCGCFITASVVRDRL